MKEDVRRSVDSETNKDLSKGEDPAGYILVSSAPPLSSPLSHH